MLRIQHLSQALEARFMLISNSWPACNIMENRHILSCKNYSSGHHLTVWHSGDNLLLEKFCKCICVFESLKVTGLSGEYVASAPSVHQASLCLPINIANPPPLPPPPPPPHTSDHQHVWLSGVVGLIVVGVSGFFFKFIYLFWQRTSGGGGGRGREREDDRGSEADSAECRQPDAGLEFRNCEIMTWAEVGCLTDWACQAPIIYCLLWAHCQRMLKRCSKLTTHVSLLISFAN